MRRSRARQLGFTLLEVMVAMGILSFSLTYLVLSQVQSARASNHAKMITTATLLARARMHDLEDELFEEGFTDLGVEANGDFSDEGFPNFRWDWIVENVELPTVHEAQEAAAASREAEGDEGGSANVAAPNATTASAMSTGTDTADTAAGAFDAQFGMIRGILEASVRRGTFKVFWTERSKEHGFTVQAYYTDPSRIGAALAGGPTSGSGSGPGGQGN